MEKYEVSIGCKIFTDDYPYLNGSVTGQEIYEHLTQSIYHENDKCIWYLGSCDKFGGIEISTDDEIFHIHWSYGEASYENIKLLIQFLSRNGIVPYHKCMKLIGYVWEGQKIGTMYDIEKYLEDGRKFRGYVPLRNIKQHDICRFIRKAKDLVKKHMAIA